MSKYEDFCIKIITKINFITPLNNNFFKHRRFESIHQKLQMGWKYLFFVILWSLKLNTNISENQSDQLRRSIIAQGIYGLLNYFLIYFSIIVFTWMGPFMFCFSNFSLIFSGASKVLSLTTESGKSFYKYNSLSRSYL